MIMPYSLQYNEFALFGRKSRCDCYTVDPPFPPLSVPFGSIDIYTYYMSMFGRPRGELYPAPPPLPPSPFSLRICPPHLLSEQRRLQLQGAPICQFHTQSVCLHDGIIRIFA